jgi:hypothetical protein
LKEKILTSVTGSLKCFIQANRKCSDFVGAVFFLEEKQHTIFGCYFSLHNTSEPILRITRVISLKKY